MYPMRKWGSHRMNISRSNEIFHLSLWKSKQNCKSKLRAIWLHSPIVLWRSSRSVVKGGSQPLEKLIFIRILLISAGCPFSHHSWIAILREDSIILSWLWCHAPIVSASHRSQSMRICDSLSGRPHPLSFFWTLLGILPDHHNLLNETKPSGNDFIRCNSFLMDWFCVYDLADISSRDLSGCSRP
jgi:hypothetical protein